MLIFLSVHSFTTIIMMIYLLHYTLYVSYFSPEHIKGVSVHNPIWMAHSLVPVDQRAMADKKVRTRSVITKQ